MNGNIKKYMRFALILNVESYLNSNISKTFLFPHPFPISVEISYFIKISLFEYDQISNNVFFLQFLKYRHFSAYLHKAAKNLKQITQEMNSKVSPSIATLQAPLTKWEIIILQ